MKHNDSSMNAGQQRPLPVAVYPLWKLCLPPILVTAASAVIIFTSIDSRILSLSDLCTSEESPFPETARIPGIGPLCCALSVFFAATVSSPWAKLFISTFLSFVASVMTISLAESQRSDSQPNLIVRHPVAPWLVLNALSGAVVTPLMMAPASFHHTQSRLCCRAQSMTTATPVGLKHLAVRSEATFTIPIAVFVGFIIPSAALIFSGVPEAILTWQFFPVFVVASLSLQHRIVHSRRIPRRCRRHFTSLQSDRSDSKTALILFSVPIATSVLSHFCLIVFALSYLWLSTPFQAPYQSVRDLTGSAILLLAVNYGATYVTVIYWLFVEGGVGCVLEALKWTVLAGSAFGVYRAWMVREKAMRQFVGTDSSAVSISSSGSSENN